MDIGVISSRYAKALLKSAVAANAENRVYADMQSLARCYMEVSELRPTIGNPMFALSKKEEILQTACGHDVTELSKRFIHLVLDKGREDMILFMAMSYVTLYRRHKQLIQGKLTTAVPVSPDTEKRLKLLVEQKTKQTVDFQTEVNADIIGGFILEYDTYRMDASVKSKLKSILKELKNKK